MFIFRINAKRKYLGEEFIKSYDEEFRYPEDAENAAHGYWLRRGKNDSKVVSVQFIDCDGMRTLSEWKK